MAKLIIVDDDYREPKHWCSVCGQSADEWGEPWVWYGNWIDYEECEPIIKLCSEVCREKAKEIGLIPIWARIIDDDDNAALRVINEEP